MAFGPTIRMKIPARDESPKLTIELAPLTSAVMHEFVGDTGRLQSLEVTRFLGHRLSPVIEDEMEWFEKVRKDKESVVWGVWIVDGATRTLIGNTSLNGIETFPAGIIQATSGVMLFKPFWGKGIASYIHRARTWYAFSELGITRIKSAVIQGNAASKRALEKCGYTQVYVEYNTCLVDGRLHAQDNLECLNPLDPFWSLWWGERIASEVDREARKKSLAALEWAKQHLELP